MTLLRFHSAVGYFLLLIGFLTVEPAVAQKNQKKRKNSDTYARSIRHREAEFYFTEGEKYFILEDYAKALLYYQKSLEVNPENATIHYKIAEVLANSEQQDDLFKASLSAETALKLESGNKYFYLLAANIYNAMAQFDKAADTYESMIREVPGTEAYLYELASIYQYENKADKAIETYDRAEQVFGVTDASSVQKMRLYLEANKRKEAIAEGEKLLAAYPSEERYVMGFAEVLAKEGMPDLAISKLETFVQENEESGNAKMLLAGLYRDAGQEQKARALLAEIFDDPAVELQSKIIILGSYNAELNQVKASHLEDRDSEVFAFSLLDKLLTAFPEEVNVHILAGDLYLTVNRLPEAIKEYERAIALDEVNYEVWQNILYLETRLGQFERVIKHSDQALELFPNQGMLYYFNGYGHLRRKHFQEAVMALEQVNKLKHDDEGIRAEVFSMLGDAYNALKQYNRSDEAYDAALAINPNNAMVLNNYSYYLALRKEKLEHAEKMAAQLVKNNPDNATYLDTYAWVLFMREKYKDAKKVMERAIATGKADAVHFEHYGDILYKLGDVNEAVGQWEKARGANTDNELLNKKIANRKIYE